MDWCLEMMICDVYWLFLCEENVKISRKISFTSHNLSLVSPNYICPPAPRLPAAKKRAKSLLFINQPSSLSARCFQRGWKEVSEDMLQNNLKMLGKCSISSDLQGSQWKIFSHSFYNPIFFGHGQTFNGSSYKILAKPVSLNAHV